MKDVKKCIEECLACVTACQNCATICVREKHNCGVLLCLDCADICNLCAVLCIRSSDYLEAIRELCIKACTDCAIECEKYEHVHCKAAAVACRKCVDACA